VLLSHLLSGRVRDRDYSGRQALLLHVIVCAAHQSGARQRRVQPSVSEYLDGGHVGARCPSRAPADNGPVDLLSEREASKAVAWLDERVPNGFTWLPTTHRRNGATGYDVPGWEATVWIMHATWENEALPSGITHDEARRIEETAGVRQPIDFGSDALTELLRDAWVTGGTTGGSAWPGNGWERLRWSELATRLETPFPSDVPPCDRWFPFKSWPLNIQPPSEGSVDQEQFARLIQILAKTSPPGSQPICHAYYTYLSGRFDDTTIYRCELGETAALYVQENGSPTNLWPKDRSWFVYTDWDFLATKVSGSKELIAELRRDDALETTMLDF
jgi:hypothetical protein